MRQFHHPVFFAENKLEAQSWMHNSPHKMVFLLAQGLADFSIDQEKLGLVAERCGLCYLPGMSQRIVDGWSERVGLRYVTWLWTLSGFAFLSVASHTALPLIGTAVPATLQPQAVLIVASLWPRDLARKAVFGWLAAGFLGAPVFAMGNAAPWLWVMPSAGYLLAYIPVTLLLTRWRLKGALATMGQWLLASAFVLLMGSAWLSLFVGSKLAFTQGVAPFVLGDFTKACLAAAAFAPVLSSKSR